MDLVDLIEYHFSRHNHYYCIVARSFSSNTNIENSKEWSACLPIRSLVLYTYTLCLDEEFQNSLEFEMPEINII